MAIKQTQFIFNGGELDPLLLGRTDLEKYYTAAETMTNVIVLPQGGFKKSPGLEYINQVSNQLTWMAADVVNVPNGGTQANVNDDDEETFSVTTVNVSTTNNYVVATLAYDTPIYVKFIDVNRATLTSGSVADEFFIQARYLGVSDWTVYGVAIPMSQTESNYRAEVNGILDQIRFIRIGTTDLGTAKVSISGIDVYQESETLSNAALIPFEFSTTQSYMLLVTARNIAVYENGELKVNVKAAEITNAMIPNLKYTQSADTCIIVHEDLYPQKLIRYTDEFQWLMSRVVFDNIPRFDFDPVITEPAGTLTPSATEGIITLTASVAPPFSTSSVGQYLQGAGGRARIIEYVSTTVVRCITEIPFYSTTAIATGDWEYLTGFEDVWSSTRGYPKTVVFHEARLWFGGSKSRPQTIWGSKTNLFFDFDLGSLYDDEAINATLDTNQVNEIINIKSSNGNLMIFTTGDEFVVSSTTGITPQNFYPKTVSRVGGEKGYNVFTLENNNVFIKRGGKSLIQYVYDSVQQTYAANDISLLSSHLIENPQDFSLRRATSTEEGNLILFVKTNGEVSMGTILLSQNVIGFTRRTTDGTFLNTGVDIEDIYFVIEREIDGTTVRYLERFNSDAQLDSSYIANIGTPTDTFSGLDHLEGETVKVIADGSVMQDRVVSSGSITIERDAESTIEIGLDMTPTVVTLPVEVQQMGSTIGKKKRISGVIMRVYDTQDFTINDDLISFRTFGVAGDGSPLDAPPPAFTGDKRVMGLLGWNDRQQITISQNDPAKINVLSVTIQIGI